MSLRASRDLAGAGLNDSTTAGPIDVDVSRLEGRSTLFYALTLAGLVVFLEAGPMGINIVLPALRTVAIHFRTTQIAWSSTALALVAAAGTPLVGKVSDIIGKKLTIGIVTLLGAVGCAISALAPTFGVFLVGRALTGLSITAMTPAYGLVRDVMPRRIVPIAMGVLVTGLGVGTVLAPFIAAWLLGWVGYSGIFWFLAIYSVVTLPLLLVSLPESKVRIAQKLDVAGVTLLAGAVVFFLLTLSQSASWGWTGAGTLAFAALAVGFGVAFVLVERAVAHPAINIRLLASRPMAMTMSVALLSLFPVVTIAYLLPQMLETPKIPGLDYAFGYSATGYAVHFLGFGLVGIVAGPLGGWLARRRGPRATMIVAMTAMTLALGGLTLWHTQAWEIVVLAAAAGFGWGFTFASTPNLIVEAVPVTQQGAGAGILGVAQNLGQGIAPVVIGVILAHNVLLRDPTTHLAVPNDQGIGLGLAFGAVGALAALVITLFMSHGRQPASGGQRSDAAHHLTGHPARVEGAPEVVADQAPVGQLAAPARR